MDKIKIVKSKIHGKGIFATQDFKKGEFIGFVKGAIKHFKPNDTTDSLSYPDWIGFKKNYWIDPLPPFKFINHSCNANCGIAGTKKVYAVRSIEKGEEMTLDYSITEIEPEWFLKCNCGSKNCRKKVGSILTMPKKIFDTYQPYIPTYMKKYYLLSIQK